MGNTYLGIGYYWEINYAWSWRTINIISSYELVILLEPIRWFLR